MSLSKQEKIVCAAVRYEYISRETGDSVLTEAYGVSYLSIIDSLYGNHNLECPKLHDGIASKGFVTNKNRFVSPEEALQITGRQNEMRFQNRKYLLPEDLY